MTKPIRDYNQAVQLMHKAPGTIVHFEGVLPSGFQAEQKMVRVPNGGNMQDFIQAVGGDVTTCSDAGKGFTVIGTHLFDGKPVSGWRGAGYGI